MTYIGKKTLENFRGIIILTCILQVISLCTIRRSEAVGLSDFPFLLEKSVEENVPKSFYSSLEIVIKSLKNRHADENVLKDLKKLRKKNDYPYILQDSSSTLNKGFSLLENISREKKILIESWKNSGRLSKIEFSKLSSFPKNDLNSIPIQFFIIVSLWSALIVVFRGSSLELSKYILTRKKGYLFSRTRLDIDVLEKYIGRAINFLISLTPILAIRRYVVASYLGIDLGIVFIASVTLGVFFGGVFILVMNMLKMSQQSIAESILKYKLYQYTVIIICLFASAAILDAMDKSSPLNIYLSYSKHILATFLNTSALLVSAFFIINLRRPVANLICNRKFEEYIQKNQLPMLRIISTYWWSIGIVLVAISIFSMLYSYDEYIHTSTILYKCLISIGVLVICVITTRLLFKYSENTQWGKTYPLICLKKIKKLMISILQLTIYLVYFEVFLRVWGLSLLFLKVAGDGFVSRTLDIILISLIFIIVWIISDTAIYHITLSSKKEISNTRLRTLLPIIRKIVSLTVFMIGLLVILANLGINVIPVVAGAGVIGISLGFGAKSFVTDLIAGLLILFENSLGIDDYVDLEGHCGTVEGLTIRTIHLRDVEGIIHIVPFSHIKSIKNYSKGFGYAILRISIPYSMLINTAIEIVLETEREISNDSIYMEKIWSPLEIQGIEKFESGNSVIRARFKTAPLKQWEIARRFNFLFRQNLDKRGLHLSTSCCLSHSATR